MPFFLAFAGVGAVVYGIDRLLSNRQARRLSAGGRGGKGLDRWRDNALNADIVSHQAAGTRNTLSGSWGP